MYVFKKRIQAVFCTTLLGVSLFLVAFTTGDQGVMSSLFGTFNDLTIVGRSCNEDGKTKNCVEVEMVGSYKDGIPFRFVKKGSAFKNILIEHFSEISRTTSSNGSDESSPIIEIRDENFEKIDSQIESNHMLVMKKDSSSQYITKLGLPNGPEKEGMSAEINSALEQVF